MILSMSRKSCHQGKNSISSEERWSKTQNYDQNWIYPSPWPQLQYILDQSRYLQNLNSAGQRYLQNLNSAGQRQWSLWRFSSNAILGFYRWAAVQLPVVVDYIIAISAWQHYWHCPAPVALGSPTGQCFPALFRVCRQRCSALFRVCR